MYDICALGEILIRLRNAHVEAALREFTQQLAGRRRRRDIVRVGEHEIQPFAGHLVKLFAIRLAGAGEHHIKIKRISHNRSRLSHLCHISQSDLKILVADAAAVPLVVAFHKADALALDGV